MNQKTWLGIVVAATLGAVPLAATAVAADAPPAAGAAPPPAAGGSMGPGMGMGMHGGPGMHDGGPDMHGPRHDLGPPGMGMGMGMMGRGMNEHFAQVLGLSDAQRQKIRAAYEAARPGMQQLRERARQNAEKLRSAKPGDKNYDSVVAEVARSAGEIASQMVRDGAKLRAQVWSELTPEQRIKAEALRDDMRLRMKERGGARWGGERHRGPPGAMPPPAPPAPPAAPRRSRRGSVRPARADATGQEKSPTPRGVGLSHCGDARREPDASRRRRPGTGREALQFTMFLRFFSGIARTFFEAGLALNIIFSPVKGLTPSRALVAGFLTTFIFRRPGRVKRPCERRLFLIKAFSASNTAEMCLRESSVSFASWFRISDFVGAPPFFAMLIAPRI
ncbi:MAG: Spy/CpxP family protein refolding chaperone [Steroidobacteraceae bacterium]